MRRSIVLLFLVCLVSGAWQSGEEFALSKLGQVTDLSVSDNGELWVLSTTGISRIDKNGDLVTTKQAQGARTLAVLGGTIYYIDNSHRLMMQPVRGDKSPSISDLMFANPQQMAALSLSGTEAVVVLESRSLSFATPSGILSTLSANGERFALVPDGDYSERTTPFYTVTGSRIMAWTGGQFQDAGAYTSRLVYSTSNAILDFCADRGGNLYVLFTDSILVLDEAGQYKGKIGVKTISQGSRILSNPTESSLLIFDQQTKNVQVVSQTANEARELIILNKNLPNPVDNYTEISFTISEPLHLTITIYNLIGEPVKQIAKDRYLKGTHRVVWRADDVSGNLVPNGVYFYRLESKRGVAIKQLVVLR